MKGDKKDWGWDSKFTTNNIELITNKNSLIQPIIRDDGTICSHTRDGRRKVEWMVV